MQLTTFHTGRASCAALHGGDESDTEKFFKHFFSQKNLFSTIPHTPWSPPTDVYETPEQYVVKLEIPGIEDVNRDVDIEINVNVLTVRGYRRDRCTDTKLNYQQMEIHYGYFERVVTLPHQVDSDVREGTYEHGFLRILIGKSKKQKSGKRRINIES